MARLLGWAIIALVFHATLTAIVLLASWMLLQRGITPDLPWLSAVQNHLYMKGARSIWQTREDCIDFDAELIYKPREGTCTFNNAEFKTTQNFTAEGRFTGAKPTGTGIAVIGDSHAMGWGVQDEETFSAELQKISRRPVYNLAVSSYGTVRELRRLERSGLMDRVDTVILQYCDNDLEENRLNRLSDIEENRKKYTEIAGRKESRKGLQKMLARAYRFAFTAPFKGSRHGRATRKPKDFAPHYESLIAVLEKYEGLRQKRVLVFYTNAHGRPFKSYPAGKDQIGRAHV